jgi:glycosyltransferase involved in cell wall biosynthesis
MLLERERDSPPLAPSLPEGEQVDAADRRPITPAAELGSPLKILHVFRAPVGGLFRHVLDLARGQVARGHQVGFVCDSNTGGARAQAALDEIAPLLALGISRFPMQRPISTRDVASLRHVQECIGAVQPDVVHGHGAKGAAYSRLARVGSQTIRAYTPHGGSLVYRPGTLGGLFYRTIEWTLMWRTDLFLFESTFANDTFRAEVGRPRSMVRIVCNGVGASEFAPVVPVADPTDIVFIGELRPVKGIDTLIDAVAALRSAGRALSVTIVGDGPNREQLVARAADRGLGEAVRFFSPMPARQAFARGRLMVVSSRAESLPYVVLEAAAAGMPLVATDVGGIPEIFGPQALRLIAPDDPAALARAISAALDRPADTQAAARMLQARVRSVFSIDHMVDAVVAGYRDALAAQPAHIG